MKDERFVWWWFLSVEQGPHQPVSPDVLVRNPEQAVPVLIRLSIPSPASINSARDLHLAPEPLQHSYFNAAHESPMFALA